ncbi:hypothetical protein FO519_003482 [Halicephalobus sp. NKZ332]|nr:hypothetical protein FO519_003482 [Halicephalobus sp. NKZ332]
MSGSLPRKEVRPTDNETYWKLHHIKEPYSFCNVYGVITRIEKIDSSYDVKGQGEHFTTQDQFRLKLISKPGMEPMDVTIYASLNTLPGDVFVVGNVVRIRKIKVVKFNTKPALYLSGRLKTPTSVVVFEFNDKLEKTIIYKSDINAIFTEIDENTIEYLKPAITFVKNTSPEDDDGFDREGINDEDYAPSNSNEEQLPSSSTSSSPNKNRRVVVVSRQNPSQRSPSPRKRTTISQDPPEDVDPEYDSNDFPECDTLASHRDLDAVEIYDEVKRRIGRFMHIYQYTRFCNIACEVVSAYCGNKEFNILRVWDGSRAPCRLKTSNRAILLMGGFEPTYGDPKLEAQIEAENKLYDIICWEKHGVDAVQLNPGDWVVLKNVNYVTSRDTLAIHAGWSSYKFFTGIEKLKRDHPVYNILKNQMEDARKGLKEIQEVVVLDNQGNPESVDGQNPQDISQGTSRNVTQGNSQNVSQRSPQNISQRSPQNISQQSPRNVTQRSPQNISQRSPRDITQQTPRNVTQGNSQNITQRLLRDVTQIPLGFDMPLAIRPREGSDEDTQGSPNRSNNRRPITSPRSAPSKSAVSVTPSKRTQILRSQTTPRKNFTRKSGSQNSPSSSSKEVQESPSRRKSPRTPVRSSPKKGTPNAKSKTKPQSTQENPERRRPASESPRGKRISNRQRNSSGSEIEEPRKLRMTGERLKRILESSDDDKNNKSRKKKAISDATQLMEAEIEDSQPKKKRKSQ